MIGVAPLALICWMYCRMYQPNEWAGSMAGAGAVLGVADGGRRGSRPAAAGGGSSDDRQEPGLIAIASKRGAAVVVAESDQHVVAALDFRQHDEPQIGRLQVASRGRAAHRIVHHVNAAGIKIILHHVPHPNCPAVAPLSNEPLRMVESPMRNSAGL